MNITEIYAAFAALRNAFLYSMQQTYTDIDRSHVEHALYGSIKFSDAYTLYRLLDKTRPKRMLEVGSFLGFSTRWLLEASRDLGSQLTAVDPNIRHRVFDNPRGNVERFNHADLGTRLEIVTAFFGKYGASVRFHYKEELQQDQDFEAKLLAERPILDGSWGRRFDFIFIDGDHSYESAYDNFCIARQLLEPGGTIAFHDVVTWKGVRQAFDELKERFADEGDFEILNAQKIYEHPALAEEQVALRNTDGIATFVHRA